MRLAFCLFKYFPYGGLQRDFLRILRVCKDRGHEIHVFTMRWDGEMEPDIHLHLLPAQGWQNHSRLRSFVRNLDACLQARTFDLVVGFNKMPGLDVYYAADICYQSRAAQQHFLYRLLPRYKQLTQLESAVFAQGNKTEIMLISPLQQKEFERCYQTESTRFHLLPPGIAKDRMAPPNAAQIREQTRKNLALTDDHYLLLAVGSGFKTKGLDRAMKAIAALPQHLRSRCSFIIIGQDNPAPFKRLASRLDIAAQLHFLGGRDDVRDFMLAADVLLHPAYYENTGTVLLEAMIAGLPVLTVATCGFAHYITDSKSGMVLPLPYEQAQFNAALEQILLSKSRKLYNENGLAFAKHADIYSMPENAADLIEKMAEHRAFTSTRTH